jgi:protease I
MRALILTANGVEDWELFYPYYRFKEEAVEVDVASPEGEKILGEHGYSLEANLSFADASAEDYDLLFLPGGRGPEKVRLQPEAVEITKRMFEADKLITAICHGPQVLISADVVRGKRATCWPALRDDLGPHRLSFAGGSPIKAAGAEYLDQEVVVDGNLITSRCPPDLPAFYREIFAAVRQAV